MREAGRVKTTMGLPDELMRAVKLWAVVQGRTVKDLVADYLGQGLGLAPRAEEMDSSPMVEIGTRGLPAIRCASVNRMSVVELFKLEQETLLQEDMLRASNGFRIALFFHTHYLPAQ